MGTSEVKRRWHIYKKKMVEQFWSFQKRYYGGKKDLFEKTYSENPERPPVFVSGKASENILVNPGAGQNAQDQVKSLIPKKSRHYRFASMSSSQALAQSVFGNLIILDKLAWLKGLIGDDGTPIFIRAQDNLVAPEMEKIVLYLGETSRKTNIDLFFGGSYQVAVECKLTEPEVGPCSRPRMKRNEANYDNEFCDGTYAKQRGRIEGCSLTQIGVKYWHHVPHFFRWDPLIDHDPCPLRTTYQLVRNVLAAGLKAKSGIEDEAEPSAGHAVLLYDERNPQFQEGGDGWQAYNDVKNGLSNPRLLQFCTWQRVVGAMAGDRDLGWLVEGLREKYGLEAKTS